MTHFRVLLNGELLHEYDIFAVCRAAFHKLHCWHMFDGTSSNININSSSSSNNNNT